MPNVPWGAHSIQTATVGTVAGLMAHQEEPTLLKRAAEGNGGALMHLTRPQSVPVLGDQVVVDLRVTVVPTGRRVSWRWSAYRRKWWSTLKRFKVRMSGSDLTLMLA